MPAIAMLRAPWAMLAAGAVIGAAATAGVLPSRLALAQCQATAAGLHAAAQDAAARAAATALESERQQRAAADRIQTTLTDTLQAQRTTAQERLHAISTPRDRGSSVCLRDPVVRMLDGAPGLRVVPVRGAADLGAAGADAPHAASAASAGQLESSEQQVGAWMIDAAASYEECRARLDALIDYVETAERGSR